jgi:hypothetical protein
MEHKGQEEQRSNYWTITIKERAEKVGSPRKEQLEK